MSRPIRSVAAQTIHYLARPHSSIPSAPIGGARAWTVAELGELEDYVEPLSAAELEALEPGALEPSCAAGLPSLGPRIAAIRRILVEGRGFVLLRGLPVQRWSSAQTEGFMRAFGDALGIPGAQDDDGALVGHVRDEGGHAPGTVRQYRTNEHIMPHCDAADAVGLLCLRAAKRGGRSRLASSAAIFDHMLVEQPELARTLFEPLAVDSRGSGGVDSFVVPPCAHHEGRLRTFFHAEYMLSAQRYPGVRPLSSSQRAAVERFTQLAISEDYSLSMELLPGDLQLVNNHSIVHARDAFEDHELLGARRHLLRLWLSLEPTKGAREWALRGRAAATIVARLVRRKLQLRRAP